MGIFSRFASKGLSHKVEAEAGNSCPHTVLLPHWNEAEDIGQEARASWYVCESCKEIFGPEAARLLRLTEEMRLIEALRS